MPSDGPGTCSVFAFYGVDPASVQNRAIYDLATAWFDTKRQLPNKIIYRLIDQKSSSKSKCESFKRSYKIKADEGFANCASFSVSKIEENGFLIDPVVSLKNYAPRCCIISARDSVANLDEVTSFSLTLIDALCPEYGIGFVRERSKGPTLFANGTIYGGVTMTPEEEEENRQTARWNWHGLENSLHRNGIIRDVYPYNLLNQSHLKMRIDGTTLKKWIAANALRGELTKLNGELSLWKVDAMTIPDLRYRLLDAGIVFDWRKYD